MNLIFIFIISLIIFVSLPFLIPSRLQNHTSVLSYQGNIPRILFRTIESLDTNFLHWRDCDKKWRDLNPIYSIFWFTNSECDSFLKIYCPERVYDAYRTLVPGAYKADLWRLCILYLYGGVYIDAYATPHVSLDDMFRGCISEESSFVSILDSTSFQAVHNGFIACSRHHPFIRKTIENIVQNVESRFYGSSSLDITGPVALSKSILSLTKKSRHKIGWNHNNTFSYYLYRHEYGINQNIYKNKLKILSKYFSLLFYLYHKCYKKGYSKLWKERKVYLA